MQGPSAGSASEQAAPEFPADELGSATQLLQELLRINTSNPPGNEREATELVARHCRSIGLKPEVVGSHAARPNLVARWGADPTNQTERPLVLSCHLDVVPANPDRWTHPPFSGHHDGECIWGRGAIDMKGFAAMGLATLTRLVKENPPINRDVIFVAVCDEEAGTRHGSEWLVNERPDLLGDNPEYVINEVGGFTIHQNGRRYYSVQVAEKGVAWLRLTVKGQPGHSSLPLENNAVVLLAKAIDAIGSTKLPWHPSREAADYIQGFTEPKGGIAHKLSPILLHPFWGPRLLRYAVASPTKRATVEGVLRNTANPTGITGSPAINVIAGSASVEIDGRLAPGQTAASLIEELTSIIRPVLGDNFEFTILQDSPPVTFSADTPLYQEMVKTLQSADPEGHVMPSIIPGFTDSRNYAKLGATCYGFYPLQLPEDIDFATLFHGDNERIPEAGFHWGIRTLTDMLRRFLVTD